MELINTHCHSKYCGHGQGEISQYVKHAIEAGITTLAFTEHYPLTASFDPDHYLSVLPENKQAYIDAVQMAREENPDIEILLGWEMDHLGNDEDRTINIDELKDCDILLGSVHFVDRWPFDDPAQRDVWKEEGMVDKIWRRYTDIWCDAAADRSLPYDVMSHPDLAKKFAYYPNFDLTPIYAQMAEAARAGERLIELNTSGAYYACKEPFPAPDLLKEFCRAGVGATLGTDAHDPANVARDIEIGYRLLYDAGYRELTVPTRSGDRRKIAIEFD